MKISLTNNSLLKYGPFILLVLMITMQMKFIVNISIPLFYLLFGIYTLLFFLLTLQGINFKILMTKVGIPFFILIILTLMYFFIFDQSLKGFLYIINRYVFFSVVIYALYIYYDYYRYQFFNHLQYVFIAILIMCIIYPNISFDRFTGIFNNANSTGFLGVLGFSLILFMNNIKYRKIFLLAFFLLVIFSGSRTALVELGIAVMMYMGLNYKKILIVSFSLLIVIALSSFLESVSGVKTGLSRFAKPSDTEVDASIISGRDMVYLLGYKTILNKPISGYGLDKYDYIDRDVVDFPIDPNFAYNPHNSYISIFIQYGVIFASLILILTFIISIKILRSPNVEKYIKFSLIVSALGAATESYLFSAMGYEGFLFWFMLALGLQQTYLERKKDAI